MPFISFSCLIAVDRTSDTMLSKGGKSECPCLVPDLRGNVPHFFTIETDVNCGLITYALCYVEVRSLCTHFKSFGFFFFK